MLFLTAFSACHTGNSTFPRATTRVRSIKWEKATAHFRVHADLRYLNTGPRSFPLQLPEPSPTPGPATLGDRLGKEKGRGLGGERSLAPESPRPPRPRPFGGRRTAAEPFREVGGAAGPAQLVCGQHPRGRRLPPKPRSPSAGPHPSDGRPESGRAGCQPRAAIS